MNSELRLIRMIDNENIDEIFIFPSLILVLYITIIHLIFYDYINEYVLCVLSFTVIMINVEYYYQEFQDISNELKQK